MAGALDRAVRGADDRVGQLFFLRILGTFQQPVGLLAAGDVFGDALELPLKLLSVDLAILQPLAGVGHFGDIALERTTPL